LIWLNVNGTAIWTNQQPHNIQPAIVIGQLHWNGKVPVLITITLKSAVRIIGIMVRLMSHFSLMARL